MMYPLVHDLAVDGIPVTVTCRVLGFSKQAFYKWQANPVTDREWDDAHLINAALDIHHDDPAFGYRFIADQLAERGIDGVGEPGATPVPAAADLVGVREEERALTYGRPAGARRPRRSRLHRRGSERDLADRHHRAPNRSEGKLYLCAIKDVWSTRIVGYSIVTG